MLLPMQVALEENGVTAMIAISRKWKYQNYYRYSARCTIHWMGVVDWLADDEFLLQPVMVSLLYRSRIDLVSRSYRNDAAAFSFSSLLLLEAIITWLRVTSVRMREMLRTFTFYSIIQYRFHPWTMTVILFREGTDNRSRMICVGWNEWVDIIAGSIREWKQFVFFASGLQEFFIAKWQRRHFRASIGTCNKHHNYKTTHSLKQCGVVWWLWVACMILPYWLDSLLGQPYIYS